jgi:hypothetical protein
MKSTVCTRRRNVERVTASGRACTQMAVAPTKRPAWLEGHLPDDGGSHGGAVRAMADNELTRLGSVFSSKVGTHNTGEAVLT